MFSLTAFGGQRYTVFGEGRVFIVSQSETVKARDARQLKVVFDGALPRYTV